MKFSLSSRLGLGLLLLSCLAQADTWSFSLVQAGLGGSAGSTVEWEYDITNNSTTDYLQLFSVASDTAFANASTDAGAGLGDSVFDFPEVAPGQTDVIGPLFAIMWNADAPGGFVNSGNFIVSAEWFADSGESIDLGAAADMSAHYTATVTPEPGGVAFIIPAFLLVAWCLRKNLRIRATNL